MANLLRVDASARLNGSHSRLLGDYAERLWLNRNPADRVLRRDLAVNPVESIRSETITGFYAPAEAWSAELAVATRLSDELIDELQRASVLLVTTPMYNFSVPAALKAWIDQVVRIGHTFSYDGQSFAGHANPDRAIVICAYGAAGYREGGDFAAANFLEPYLGFLFGFLGIPTVEFVAIEATTGDETLVATNVAGAKADIDALLAS